MNSSGRHSRKEEDRRTPIFWSQIWARSTLLDACLTSPATRALMYAGTGTNVMILTSCYEDEVQKGPRECYLAALLIQSRGNKKAGCCDACSQEGPAPFEFCVRVEGHFNSACASCVFKEVGDRCSHAILPSTPPVESGLSHIPAKPQGGELPEPEVMDLETPTPSGRTPTNTDAAAMTPALQRATARLEAINLDDMPRTLAYDKDHGH